MNPDIGWVYTIPYYLLLMVYGLIAAINLKSERGSSLDRLTLLLCPVILFLFWGFRGYVATDWRVYQVIFEDIGEIMESISSGEEPPVEIGFCWLTYFIHAISHSYLVFQVVLTALNIVLLHCLFKLFSPIPVISWVIWFAGFLLFHDLMRNVIALLICAIAFRFIVSREFVKYCICVLCASIFHQSVLVFLPFYFLLRIRLPIWCYAVILGISIIACLCGWSVFEWFVPVLEGINHNAQNYLHGQFETSFLDNRKYIFVLLPIAYFGCLVLKREKKNEVKFTIFYNCFICFFLSLCWLTGNGEVQRRVSYLFMWSIPVLIPLILDRVEDSFGHMIVLLYVALFCIHGCHRYNNMMWKYQNALFTRLTPFEEREAEIENANWAVGSAGQERK